MFSISLEPVTFFFAIGLAILDGAQVTTDLLLWKVCHLELNYSEDICSNLTQFESIESEVQQNANDFLMLSQWLSNGPALIYAIFAGALADDFGFKPFIILPFIGLLLGDIGMLLNFLFIKQLPLETFLLDRTISLFGGFTFYFLGMYGYAMKFSQPNARATTVSRYQGFEILGIITGTFLSPIILKEWGAVANYSIRIGCSALVLFYTIFIIKEPERDQEKGPNKKLSLSMLLKPIKDMLKAIFQRRTNALQYLLLIQFTLYALYFFDIEYYGLLYLYLQKYFDFDGTDYSYFRILSTCMTVLGTLVLMPLLSLKCKIHDALLQTIFVSMECLALLLFAFSNQVWQVYLTNGIIELIGSCKWALLRTLTSKSVQPNEIGKMFSFFAILGSLIPLASNPAYRLLYNATLDTFPPGVLVMAGGVMFLGVILNVILYLQRWRIDTYKPQGEENEERATDAFELVENISHI